MKMIIDISDEAYELCKRGTTGTFLINAGMRSGKSFLMSLYKAIANGTPLPKGHGRLIILSEDAVKREQTPLRFSCQNWISEVGLSNATVAIIEVDKAESEYEE